MNEQLSLSTDKRERKREKQRKKERNDINNTEFSNMRKLFQVYTDTHAHTKASLRRKRRKKNDRII